MRDWRSIRVQFVTETVRRGVSSEYSEDGVTRIVGQPAVQWYGIDWSATRRTSYVPRGSDRGVLCSGDILINSTGTGTVGRVGRFTAASAETCIADGHVTIVRPRQGDADPRFLYYSMAAPSFRRAMMSMCVSWATNQIELSPDSLKRLPVSLPSTDLQSRIGKFLDDQSRAVRAIATARNRSVKLSHEYWLEELDQALTSTEFDVLSVRRVLQRPLEYGSNDSAGTGDEGWPRYLRITDIGPSGDLRNGDVKRLEPALARNFMLSDGDLLLARSGATVGKSYRYKAADGAACFAGYLVRVRPDRTRVLPDYLELWFQSSRFWKQVRALTTQSTIQNVNADRFGTMKIEVPSLDRQREIVAYFSRGRRSVKQISDCADRQIALLWEWQDALIDAATKGKVDVSTARGADV